VLEAAAATIRKQQQIAGEMLENGADVTSEAAVTTAYAVRDATRVLADPVSGWSPGARSGAGVSEPTPGHGRSGRKATSKKRRQAG
jgi:hypothetical protein